MPIYVYRCESCKREYELMMPVGTPEEIVGEEDCPEGHGSSCSLRRRYTSPSIGFVPGAGFSPARPSSA